MKQEEKVASHFLDHANHLKIFHDNVKQANPTFRFRENESEYNFL